MADLTREQIEERIQTALNLMQELGFPANVNDEGFCGCGECRNCLVGMAHNSLDELTEALRQLLSATEWKPIETAPNQELIDATKALIKYCEDHGWGEIPEPGVTLSRVLSTISKMENTDGNV